ncbi:MAG: UvrD-helicase domain-containing protein, partial [Patescibacteria group bacterium]|nr:UvrD-helicase domain-containing protein [Patescibacteria group bacterium]
MSLLKGLNKKQVEAVKTVKGPVLILAGAGSGKTKTLTSRIAYLIKQKHAAPNEILAVTFTNKAAGEMRKRVQNILRVKHLGILQIGTFHSFCARFLRSELSNLGEETNFTILGTDEQLTVAKQAMHNLDIDKERYAPGAVLSYISGAKNELMRPDKYNEFAYSNFQKIVAKIYVTYQDILAQNNSLDFDDLLMRTVEVLEANEKILKKYQKKFKFILVDEYQDTNTAQYRLIKMLSEKHNNIFVVGDDWQSIYSWRGANYHNILNFQKDYPKTKVIKLEQNYRSTQNVLSGANAVIAPNKNRSDKSLWTNEGDGEKITIKQVFNEQQEGSFVVHEILKMRQKNMDLGLNNFVILYRTNAQSRALEETFLQHNIPYRMVGGTKFYDRKEIKDTLAFLRVLANPSDEISLKRIINVPPRGIGEKTWQELQGIAGERRQNMIEVLADTPFGPKAQKALKELGELFEKGKNFDGNLSELYDLMTTNSGYMKHLDDKTIEGETRIENVKELKSVIEKYDALPIEESLLLFLEEISLIQDIDQYDENEDAVTLMTVHSAKGLEFDCVFVTGMEENIFPHSRSMLDAEELAEERRLCYVAMTRAKKKLYLSHAMQRMLFGSSSSGTPSRFLNDIPQELIEGTETKTPTIADIPTADSKRKFKTGDMVEHKHFGIGRIVSSGKNELVIRFG